MTKKHILIVDDEPKVAFFLTQALQRLSRDYEVTATYSGEEALEVLNSSSVDLLVTDLRMPGISGLELIRWVKASSPDTRTILITAYGNDNVEAEARRLEAYRYITKPFDMSNFTKVVQEALRDVAISQPGLTVLSDESFEAIVEQLETLRIDVNARCIFLADMQGQRLGEVGDTADINAPTLLALLAGGFATSGELARQFGNGEAVNLNFHEGSRYEIYSANVGENLFLAMVYERQVQSSRIGVVWLYTRRTIKDLLSTLSTVESSSSTQPLDPEFGSSLMSELDSIFADGDLPDAFSESTAEQGDGEGGVEELLLSPGQRDSSPDNGKGIADHSSIEKESVRSVEQEPSAQQGEESEDELLDLEEAIAQGLIPSDLDFGIEE